MRALALIFILSAAACTGTISSAGNPLSPNVPGGPTTPTDPTNPTNPTDPTNPSMPPPDACAGVTLAAAPSSLRRLTVEQQVNSYRDVLGDQTLAPALAAQNGPIITEQEVEQLNLAAHAMVQAGGHASFIPCDSSGAFNSTCADQFIAAFGHAVFRRPLTTDEASGFRTDVFDALRNNAAVTPAATFRECLDAVAESILQSGQFLYIHEEGVADSTVPAGFKRLSGNERAVRMSYLLWNSTPDTALLTAAESGMLDTVDGIKTQASRLLDDPKARSAVRTVVASWLQLDGNSHQSSLEAAPKDQTLFPFDNTALRTAMREETLSLYEKVFFDLGGGFSTLMTTTKSYVNKSLGQLYGVTTGLPASDSQSAWVDLDSTQRAGLFTRGAYLLLYSPQNIESPIRRGVFLLTAALGRALGTPPPNVDMSPLKPGAMALTIRAQVEQRTASAVCQQCHGRINPLGYTLGNYDAMGRYQTDDTGTLDGMAYTAPIDPDATIIDTDIQGDINGPVALAQKLGQSGMAHDAMAKIWFTHANTRAAVPTDACSLQRIDQQFRQSDDMRALVVSILTDDNALYIQESP
jgi:hypothetical protein